MFFFYHLLFFGCLVLIYLFSEWTVDNLLRLAKFLKWKKFVVAFLMMALAASLPNLFVGINSALAKIPELSFSEIVGGNIIDLTLAVALALLFTQAGIEAKGRTLQKSAIFTVIVALLPLILIFDGILSRADGIILIGLFVFYLFWIFSKEERFYKVYNDYQLPEKEKFKNFLSDLGKLILGIFLLLIAAKGIVISAQFFAQSFNLPLSLIGIFVVGVGNILPETYFAIASARKGETEMILGNLMGSVIFPSTLVLGIVALICPIKISDFSPFVIARFFLIISAFFFLIFIRTDKHLSKKEAWSLIGLYLLFVIAELLLRG